MPEFSMQPVDQPRRRALLALQERVHSTHSFRSQSEGAMVPFFPAQPDALELLTVLSFPAQPDALPRLGLSLLLDLMIEASCY